MSFAVPAAKQRRSLSRRDAIAMLAAAGVAALAPGASTAASPRPHALSGKDEQLLDELQRSASRFYTEQSGRGSGQVLDRAVNRRRDGSRDPRTMASIAATGFGLAALCAAAERGFVPRADARAQVLSTLDFHLNRLPHQHGFFFHFSHVNTGVPWRDVEVSSIDTAILLCGILTARQYFRRDDAIYRLASAIYERVDWPWMLNGGDALSMGWHTGRGFLDARWNHYCELMMLYLLAIGSPTHPIPAAAWNAFTRPRVRFAGFDYISSHDPLFVHQYSHAFFDFRRQRDAYADYFANSIAATRAHKAFCLSLGKGYTEDEWGVSASDSENGYQAWGGPPLIGGVNGTLVPNATAGSLAFVPEICLPVQHALRERYGENAFGRYGMCDAFHPATGWYDADVLGIDLGISMLMAENLRSGLIWHCFMQNEEAVRAMRLCGFRTYSA